MRLEEPEHRMPWAEPGALQPRVGGRGCGVNARAIVKTINRRCRRHRYFEGGRQFGVDYTTWVMCHPQMAFEYSRAAEALTGRKGRFIPRF